MLLLQVLLPGIPGGTLISALMLTLGIGIQNFPEGAAVSLPLMQEGYSKWKAFLYGQSSALVEPISAVIGATVSLVARPILPFLLSFAASAMIVVAMRELFPESIKENKNLSTIRINCRVCFNDDIRCSIRLNKNDIAKKQYHFYLTYYYFFNDDTIFS